MFLDLVLLYRANQIKEDTEKIQLMYALTYPLKGWRHIGHMANDEAQSTHEQKCPHGNMTTNNSCSKHILHLLQSAMKRKLINKCKNESLNWSLTTNNF